MLVGPGTCRKWRPDIALSLSFDLVGFCVLWRPPVAGVLRFGGVKTSDPVVWNNRVNGPAGSASQMQHLQVLKQRPSFLKKRSKKLFSVLLRT
jgi:hypothetical protein